MPTLSSRLKLAMANHIRAVQPGQFERCLEPESAKRLATEDAYCRLATWLPPPSSGRRVLELGCGPGRYVALLAALGYDVTGIDLQEFAEWELIRKRYAVDLRAPVQAESLPFAEAEFDHAVCLGALLYFRDASVVLRELRRVVKPGGTIVFRTVNRENFYTLRTGRKLDPASQTLYTMPELVDLLEREGFHVRETYSFGFWPPILTDFWWYLQFVWLPDWAVRAMSALTPARHRVGHFALTTR
jgi:SAM-dependent methyltransferase